MTVETCCGLTAGNWQSQDCTAGLLTPKLRLWEEEKKVSRQSLSLSRAPLAWENCFFVANKVQGAGGGLCETCLKRQELKTGATNGRSQLASQQSRHEGSRVLRPSWCPAPQAVLKAAALLGLFLECVSRLFLPLGHYLNWLSESLLPLQVPAESTGSSDLCKSDQVGPLGLGGVRGGRSFAQQILFLVRSGSLCRKIPWGRK